MTPMYNMAPHFGLTSLLKAALLISTVLVPAATASKGDSNVITDNVAAPGADASAACNEIKAALPGQVHVAKDPVYTKENKAYYNAGLAELMPRCITMPSSAQDVSKIVKILNKHAGVRFAVKSGGHDPNPGHSSVKDGVLIAMRNVAGTTYNKEKGVAYIKPGGHWSDALNPLAKDKVAVVSGRLGMQTHQV
jgi:hypothetical protein